VTPLPPAETVDALTPPNTTTTTCAGLGEVKGVPDRWHLYRVLV